MSEAIINEQSLKADFIEVLANYLQTTSDKVSKYVTDKVLEKCIEDMLQAESDYIIKLANTINISTIGE